MTHPRVLVGVWESQQSKDFVAFRPDGTGEGQTKEGYPVGFIGWAVVGSGVSLFRRYDDEGKPDDRRMQFRLQGDTLTVDARVTLWGSTTFRRVSKDPDYLAKETARAIAGEKFGRPSGIGAASRRTRET